MLMIKQQSQIPWVLHDNYLTVLWQRCFSESIISCQTALPDSPSVCQEQPCSFIPCRKGLVGAVLYHPSPFKAQLAPSRLSKRRTPQLVFRGLGGCCLLHRGLCLKYYQRDFVCPEGVPTSGQWFILIGFLLSWPWECLSTVSKDVPQFCAIPWSYLISLNTLTPFYF